MEPAPANPSREALSLKPSWKSYFVFYAAILIFGVGPVLNPEAPLSREAGVLIAGRFGRLYNPDQKILFL